MGNLSDAYCPDCHNRKPCDCWKDTLTPERRRALQVAALGKWLAGYEKREFNRRQGLRPPLEGLIRGQFGNEKAANKRTA